jgi:uncharacterized protein YecE (DUF72 family)
MTGRGDVSRAAAPAELELAPPLRWRDATIRVGTCSWAEATLVKDADWYPKKSMSAAERLAFYAAHFPLVEADSTYYRPPTVDLTRGWSERTPDGFTMNVKAYSLMTGHPTKPDTLWPDVRDTLHDEARAKANLYPHHLDPEVLDEVWQRFADALEPLRSSGRLGAVLLQYPAWFTAKKANREELARARYRLSDLPLVVEFRHPSWLGADDLDRTLGTLRDHDLALVNVDAPRVSRLPRIAEATAPLAVVRFHGRADATWKARTTTAAERFKYLYRRRQLEEWVPKVNELAARADEVHLLMNNCYQDYGVRNATDLHDLLVDAGAR